MTLGGEGPRPGMVTLYDLGKDCDNLVLIFGLVDDEVQDFLVAAPHRDDVALEDLFDHELHRAAFFAGFPCVGLATFLGLRRANRCAFEAYAVPWHLAIAGLEDLAAKIHVLELDHFVGIVMPDVPGAFGDLLAVDDLALGLGDLLDLAVGEHEGYVFEIIFFLVTHRNGFTIVDDGAILVEPAVGPHLHSKQHCNPFVKAFFG